MIRYIEISKTCDSWIINSLGNLHERLKINTVGRAHSALWDCEVSQKVYESCWKKVAEVCFKWILRRSINLSATFN
ncbi:MAG: hypothetical protein ACTS53_00840 [Candidatus Hodgkinia cicadicola]